MSNYASKVIAVLLAEVGYIEKKSNAQLDDKTANAGGNNYTKYARDLDAIPGFYNTKKQGAAYCDITVDWAFVQAYGVEEAKKLLCQPDKSMGAGCKYSAQYYKNNGQFHESDPEPGDQIFFWNDKKTNPGHTGLVVEVDKECVTTVEGNARDDDDPMKDGGGVRMKKYRLDDETICGYGRPAYDKEPAEAPEYTRVDFLKELQKVLGAPVTGNPDLVTLGMTVTVSAKVNPQHAAVKPLQKWLNALGYTEVGKDDGVAGVKFTSAVLHFQMEHGCTPTGALQEWDKTWHKLIWEECT